MQSTCTYSSQIELVAREIKPLIISASRATDIPAFYAQWFINRFREGRCVWINPFNRKQKTVVSFESCKAIVFWSKNPAPLIQYLAELDDKRISYYFQFTLNDYEEEKLEPGVPPLQKRIDTFIELSEMIGKKRIIWRFDPVLKADNLHPDKILERIQRLGESISPYTEKLVFSFIDISPYEAVKRNLKKYGPAGAAELSDSERRQFAKKLAHINGRWPHKLTLATCAEDISLEELHIERNSCVDARLICEVSHYDPELMQYFGLQKGLFGDLVESRMSGRTRETLKDSGQRKACGCAKSKDIGAYGTCMHLCTYCYANNQPERVKNNYSKCSPESESLLP